MSNLIKTDFPPYSLIYGGITIPYTKTSFESTPVYSPDGCDLLYHHIAITAQGIINPQLQPLYYTQGGLLLQKQVSNASYIHALRAQLSEPRQRLIYTDAGGYTIVDTANMNSNYGQSNAYLALTIDANNGPKAEAQTYQIDGNTIMVVIKIETWIAECATYEQAPSEQSNYPGTGPSATASYLRSNRWSMTQEIDQDNMSTYTTDGILIIRTDQQNFGTTAEGAYPDFFRNLPVPVRSIFPNCNRIHQSYRQSSDGTRLEYQVVDKEYYRPAVNGITSWSGSFTQHQSFDAANSGNMLLIGEFESECTAPPNVTKQQMFQFLSQILACRIDIAHNIILDFSMKEDLRNNSLSLNARALLQNTDVNSGTTSSGVSLKSLIPVASATNLLVLAAGNIKDFFSGSSEPDVATGINIKVQIPSDAANTAIGLGGPVYPIDSPIDAAGGTNGNLGGVVKNLTVASNRNVVQNRVVGQGYYFQNVPDDSTNRTITTDAASFVTSATTSTPDPGAQSNYPLFAQIFSNSVNTSLTTQLQGSCAYGPLTPYVPPSYGVQYASSTATSGTGTTGSPTTGTSNGGGGTLNPLGGVLNSIASPVIDFFEEAAANYQQIYAAANQAISPIFTAVTNQLSQWQLPVPAIYYTIYKLETQYFETQNTLQLPIGSQNSSSNQTAVVVPVALPTTRAKVVFNASRLNVMPVVPDPGAMNPNWVLRSKMVTLFNPTFLQGAINRVFSVYGEWEYDLSCTAQLGTNFVQSPASPIDALGTNVPGNLFGPPTLDTTQLGYNLVNPTQANCDGSAPSGSSGSGSPGSTNDNSDNLLVTVIAGGPDTGDSGGDFPLTYD